MAVLVIRRKDWPSSIISKKSGQPDAPAAGWSMARVHAWLLHRDRYWENEIAHLRKSLQDDLDAKTVKNLAPA